MITREALRILHQKLTFILTAVMMIHLQNQVQKSVAYSFAKPVCRAFRGDFKYTNEQSVTLQVNNQKGVDSPLQT